MYKRQEVIKVEAPDGGDPLRKWRKLYEGTSLWWYVQARNKKSVTANLKHPEGRKFVRKLIAEADIPVSYTHLDVYKRQEKYRRAIDAIQALENGDGT